jgi:hypothetical protein
VAVDALALVLPDNSSAAVVDTADTVPVADNPVLDTLVQVLVDTPSVSIP